MIHRPLTQVAADMRREFDRTFAEPPVSPGSPPIDCLAIRIATDTHLLRLADIEVLLADRPITPIPTRISSFLGILGHRRSIVPIYSLRALLGYPDTETRLHGIVLIKHTDRVGLAFDHFDRHVQARAGDVRGILELKQLVEEIRRLALSVKEH